MGYKIMKTKDLDLCRNISNEIIESVENKIKEHIGLQKSGEFVKIGADGTPTLYIDLIAEEEVIKILKTANFTSILISEEIGELKIGKGLVENINVSEELKRIFDSENSAEAIPKFIFLVDPLDGTSNAIKNISTYGISIAVGEIKDENLTLKNIELGFIKDFDSGNYYEAIKGEGAWENNKIMIPNTENNLGNLSIGAFLKNNSYGVFDLIKKARRIRILGSVVLELAYIANGKYDAFIDMRGSRIIDIAASKLIVEESGAIVTDENGNELNNPLSIKEKTVVIGSSNHKVHKKIIKTINNNKSSDIKKVGIVSRVDKLEVILVAAKLIQFLESKHIEVFIEYSLANKITDIRNDILYKDNKNNSFIEFMEELSESNNNMEYNNILNELKGLTLEEDYFKYAKDISEFDTDMVITLGGDGTLLRGQTKLNNNEIPLLGINLGIVGFLTELDIKNSFNKIDSILKGEYFKEKRTQLKVFHGREMFTALNEVVIMTEKPAKMLNFEVSVDGEIVEEFRADGLILSTPSGSTAYSMSAGGPIVDPKVGAFIIIPICPYKMGLRPFVVSDKSEIKVKLLKKGKKAILVMDGQISQKIDDSEEITCLKSNNNVYFIRTTDKYFYQNVKEKLTKDGPGTDNTCL
ncbi:Bifunctional NADP phosphatase/NAD kinase [Candidatus Methanobinarius endosymbioticus]|uniref:NAD kinase n=1 Tax=Candidatus Methanobinarius endosymbioticus TaxID=2006182 RepID=A0A366MEU8_9EURY|nr:Bifunctional NADP phosphatase/NAD kinase [Candidatus Methanobinarius endosymbioticus]